MHSSPRSAATAVIAYETDYRPFDPLAYMREYYDHVGAENQALLQFFDRAHAQIFSQRRQARLLEFGGGPTIYQLLSAARYDLRIDVSDYLDTNLDELRRWLHDQPGQFPWEAFIAYVLELEGACADAAAVRARAALLRSKVDRLLPCDARHDWPLGDERRPYDIVSANFVLEAISVDHAEWRRMVSNVVRLVADKGYFILSTVLGAEHYRVGPRFYPATRLSPQMVEAQLRASGCCVRLTQTVDAEHGGHQGYSGLMMVLAQKVGQDA